MSSAQSHLTNQGRRREMREKAAGLAYIMPWIIGFFAFTFVPMIISLILSFCKWSAISGVEGIEFIGLDNYVKIFTNDPNFWKSMGVTFKFALIYMPLSQVFAIVVAILLNQKVKGLKIFRALYFMPSVMPAVAVSLLWMWVFNGQYGILNQFLKFMGIQGPDWLNNPNTSLYALIIMGLWSVGNTMIIYLSGLQGVPRSLYEAAEIDGITPFKRFIHITLPMISSTMFFNIVMGIIGAFQYFTQAHVMTAGGPLKSTLFYNLYLYNVAFKDFKMGYASALAWVMFIVIMLLTMVVFKSSSMWVYYEADVKDKKKSKTRVEVKK